MKFIFLRLFRFGICIGTYLLIHGFPGSCQPLTPRPKSVPGITLNADARTGRYTIRFADPAWIFSGTTGFPLQKVESLRGKDVIGSYTGIRFQWKADQTYTGVIRCYDQLALVLFSLSIPGKMNHIQAIFPSFDRFPQKMYTFSHYDDNFAPPQFRLNQTSTPWLFFNDRDESFLISPASDFMVSRMTGDGIHVISSGLNPELQSFPAGFTHRTILVIGKGIGHTWNIWGKSLMSLYGKHRPAEDADPLLKYFGYWTDNGADYYYNYDTSLGYAGTLLAVRKQYLREGIPLGYMQLDSWWYDKSITDPEGKPDAGWKNKHLPNEAWNRYGGMMKYRADQFLFPRGLAYFHQELGLPLVVHNRWIDPKSPYRNKYHISGFAAVDPAYWKHIATYLKSSGVIIYEQDWLNYIYRKSPGMADNLSTGNEFTGDMSSALRNEGLDMQYCMAMPRYFLQGVRYPNLTTIRTSDDRFEPGKWKEFIYNSQFAYVLGIWPWSDVFKSREKGNMILAVLSAGAVGTGDALGQENKKNILLAARPDGILVKPDRPAEPMDSSFLQAARKENTPMLSWTLTRHHGLTTDYVFAFDPPGITGKIIRFLPAALGDRGEVVVYCPGSDRLSRVSANQEFRDSIPAAGYAYYIVAPVTSMGIAFLGDAGKIASTGKQRISSMEQGPGVLRVSVLYAAGEKAVTLMGYYERLFKADHGTLKLDSSRHRFTLLLSPLPGKHVAQVIFRLNKGNR